MRSVARRRRETSRRASASASEAIVVRLAPFSSLTAALLGAAFLICQNAELLVSVYVFHTLPRCTDEPRAVF